MENKRPPPRRRKLPVMTCATCGFQLYRCPTCGAIGCRHPDLDACPAQVYRANRCLACGKPVKAKMVAQDISAASGA